MADQLALTQAITALTNAIAFLQPPPQPAAVYDPFASDVPFNLSTRLGSQAYSDISSPLDEVWDGSVNTFPSFMVALTIRAKEGKWDAAAPHGILEVDGHDALTDYHTINETQITDARTARIDNRAIQNAKAMFKCVKSSIKGDIRNTIFNQTANLPEHEDGVALFWKLTTFTTVASIQLSLISLESILNFNPHTYKFQIPTINTTLLNLFSLATTRTRTLDDSERIQHTLNVYRKIVQPETWAQWVRTKTDAFEEGNITVCRDFMNSAMIKYNKIDGGTGTFKGSVSTVQEDIIALLADKHKTIKRKNQYNDAELPPLKKEKEDDAPDFIKHFKNNETGKRYQVGNTKEFKGDTYYFCDATTHKNKTKWHKHHPDKCRLRKAWLAEKDNKSENSATHQANVANVEENDNDAEQSNAAPTNISALLASAMNLATDNDILKDLIAEALNATTE